MKNYEIIYIELEVNSPNVVYVTRERMEQFNKEVEKEFIKINNFKYFNDEWN